METGWIFVIIIWSILIGVIFVCLIPEMRKTPEQRKAEAQMVRDSLVKKREEENKKRQEERDNAPAKGCLQSTLEFGCVSIFLMIAVIFFIMVIIASGH